MIFIQGGEGFVGSAFARLCEREGREYKVIQRANYPSMLGARCDVFINANGNSSKPTAERDPAWDFEASVTSVRKTLLDFDCDLYVYISSCDVYPDCSSPDSSREDDVIDSGLQTTYGFHKSLAEQCVRHAGGEWLVMRLGGSVGPGLVKNAIYDILAGGPLWVDPESRLQFLHTDDSARIIMSLIDTGVRNRVFNVCGSGVISVREAMNALGVELEVKCGSPKVRYEASIDRLASYMTVPETVRTVREFIRMSGSNC